jgi:hypothetical protein
LTHEQDLVSEIIAIWLALCMHVWMHA